MTQKKIPSTLDRLIGNNLSCLLQENGITTQALADSMNVDYKTVWNCENGRNTLTINLLIKMETMFRDKNITLSMLFDYIVVAAIDEYRNQ
ncbi:helix-turn-helix transcriptional regulator [Lactiplantibacillus dongliensis]|uniref:Helix-turn-helix transcriptional regulator n=1 Tax=Lactiplantibacillus dongliensis TaxID=2559919 RepID=A0ABW1R2F2_9LACO|nr:helix-turn-helix transcriptional regulator [Lactiplantibacillus dongliensis]